MWAISPAIKTMKQEKYESQIQKSIQWCTTIIDFVKRANPENGMAFQVFESVLTLKGKPLNAMSAKGFRQLERDIQEMAKDFLSKNEQDELNSLLESKFSKSFRKNSLESTASKVLKSGKIKTDTEYEMIEEKVAELSQTQSDEDTIKRLNHLLSEYKIRSNK